MFKLLISGKQRKIVKYIAMIKYVKVQNIVCDMRLNSKFIPTDNNNF